MSRPVVAEIDLYALLDNYRLARSRTGNGRAMAVIKADAYGHGAVPVARALEAECPAFAVACLEEAEVLRAAAINKPILLLGGFFDVNELRWLVPRNYWCVLHSFWQIQALESSPLCAPVPFWIKVDTGMHRLGFSPEDVPGVIFRLRELPWVGEIVLLTHLARADELDSDKTLRQMQVLRRTLAGLRVQTCVANSAALLGWPACDADWARPGIMLYGSSPFAEETPDIILNPVMTLKSQIIALRDLPAGEAVGYGGQYVTRRQTRLATVAGGYGDGYPRHAPPGTPVLVNGQRCPLAGRVSMDLVLVDVTECRQARIGDEVVFWGKELKVDEVAAHARTISYTLLAGVMPRVPRHYFSCRNKGVRLAIAAGPRILAGEFQHDGAFGIRRH